MGESVLYVAVSVVSAAALLPLLAAIGLHCHVIHKYMNALIRIFTEKPLFIIPRGQPVADAEEVTFASCDGMPLRGCYLPATSPRRYGVILFGLEFGSNRWACVPYTQFLRDAGYDVFTFEPRGQGDSGALSGYEPIQWVTNYEVADFKAALEYLRSRSDADADGIGFFGISKGGGSGLLAYATDPYVRCFVTDGIFGTRTTMIPYMVKWINIYNPCKILQKILPHWYYGVVASMALRRLKRERGCRFPHLEHSMPRLTPRPLLMIHGQADTYIKPAMAQVLFKLAREPKELWLVDGAKHNQAFQLANAEYQQRVLAFFDRHLGKWERGQQALRNGHHMDARRSEPLMTDR